jgi:hypothetical protein
MDALVFSELEGTALPYSLEWRKRDTSPICTAYILKWHHHIHFLGINTPFFPKADVENKPTVTFNKILTRI